MYCYQHGCFVVGTAWLPSNQKTKVRIPFLKMGLTNDTCGANLLNANHKLLTRNKLLASLYLIVERLSDKPLLYFKKWCNDDVMKNDCHSIQLGNEDKTSCVKRWPAGLFNFVHLQQRKITEKNKNLPVQVQTLAAWP